MIKLLRHLKPYLGLLAVLIILVFIQVMATLQLPDYMADIVNQGIVQQDNTFIIHTGLIMLLVSLLAAACMVAVGFLAAHIAAGFSRDVRAKVFAQVESFSLTEFNRFSTASLITRTTNDIQQIQMVLIMMMRMVLMAPLMGIGAVIKAYHNAPSMSWIIVLAVIIMFGIIAILFSVAMPKFQLLQRLVDKLNLVTRQNLTGLRVIRAFNNEKVEEAKFEKANVNLTNANLYVNRLMVIMQPIMMFLFNVTALTVIWVGAHLINSDSLQIGDMLAFMQYSMQVIMAFLMVSIVFIMIPRASVSATRVEEVIATIPLIKDPDKATLIDLTHGGVVEFKDVTFTYPGAEVPVLENISFKALPGHVTAVIGSTGSGKSTLINLIPRFYDVTAGQILIDGVDIQQMKLEDLYHQLGYVPQKPVLFSGTVNSNIKYGVPKASAETVEKAAAIAQASEFIRHLDQAFDHPISQGGTNISGGQKQRLSIARAIAGDPKIYLFDDSFSALDFRTDAALRRALNKETVAKTVIVVAQRISTIMHADQILVLDEGKMVGQGTHQELMQNCPVYQEIASSQLSEAELNKFRSSDSKLVQGVV